MRRRGALWAPLIALQFLTRIPIDGVPDWAYEEGGRRNSLIFFPLVGILVGAIGGAVFFAASACRLSVLAGAVLAVVSTAWVTGAFHEDGIADTFDALGPHDRARALEVMRDSRIGTFGSVALWAILTLKVAAIESLSGPKVFPALIAAHVLARWSSLPLSLALPYARDTAGLGAGIASLVTRRELLWASALAAAILALTLSPAQALLSASLACAVILVTGLVYRSRFGGVTGDCLGATNQIVEVAVLLAASSLCR